ncbi:MAG: restriction endonuclease, SacI family [bacterium]
MENELSFSERCEKYLRQRWNHILSMVEKEPIVEPLTKKYDPFKSNIRSCLTSNTKSYRYVLPTQLLSKSADQNLDCRSLQAAYESEGSFDARTIAHKVIVPFDKENHNVLGGSNEPYVNNPLRCTSVSKANRARQKNKKDWDKLISVLDTVENTNDKDFTRTVFDQVLLEIYKLLAEVTVVYPTPNRVSLDKTLELIDSFTAERSGGDRLEAVVTALFRTISEKFNLFDEVRREKVNAPDATTGMVADIECWLSNEIVLLVEVKDRTLNLTHLDAKIDVARSNQIKEILFMAQQGIEQKDKSKIDKKIIQEFTSGQNIYISSLVDFARGILILLGEKGRVDFIGKIGPELDVAKSSIKHRKAWAALLKEI